MNQCIYCDKCKLKIDTNDFIICKDCYVHICKVCSIGNLANHKICIKCKLYITCFSDNNDKCYDCRIFLIVSS